MGPSDRRQVQDDASLGEVAFRYEFLDPVQDNRTLRLDQPPLVVGIQGTGGATRLR